MKFSSSIRISIDRRLNSIACTHIKPSKETYNENNSQQNTLQTTADHSPLIEKVRAATARFKEINVTISEGWVRGTPCVSGPDTGAMGVHFVMPSRINNFVLLADQPQALIYEPLPGGVFRLVGVEFIALSKVWATQPDGASSTPALEGDLLNYIGEPNRYGLPAFYELHVWAPHGLISKISRNRLNGDDPSPLIGARAAQRLVCPRARRCRPTR